MISWWRIRIAKLNRNKISIIILNKPYGFCFFHGIFVTRI